MRGRFKEGGVYLIVRVLGPFRAPTLSKSKGTFLTFFSVLLVANTAISYVNMSQNYSEYLKLKHYNNRLGCVIL